MISGVTLVWKAVELVVEELDDVVVTNESVVVVDVEPNTTVDTGGFVVEDVESDVVVGIVGDVGGVGVVVVDIDVVGDAEVGELGVDIGDVVEAITDVVMKKVVVLDNVAAVVDIIFAVVGLADWGEVVEAVEYPLE